MKLLAAVLLLSVAAPASTPNWAKVAAASTIVVNVLDIKTTIGKSVKAWRAARRVAGKAARKVAGKR